MRELLITLRDECVELLDESSHLYPRSDVYFPDTPNKIKVAIGMRRSGKTCLLLRKIQALRSEGVPLSRILYINFEDDRLMPMGQEALAQLVEAFYALYPENHDQECYLFFDEIQNVDEWALVMRRVHDKQRTQIYLTGSSAKLLSSEIATELRGRSIAIEVYPFNYMDYLGLKGIAAPQKELPLRKQDQYQALLCDYLSVGGFPEVALYADEDRARVLQDYVSVAVLRDIVERYHVSNIALIRYLIKTLLKQNATAFAANKLYNTLKRQGFSVGRATLYDYLEYIEDAYLMFKVPLFDESERKVQSNPKKIYAVDTGLVHSYTFSFSKNYGRMFENVIYLDLRRRGYQVYYYLTAERYEVDFLVRSLTGKIKLYQVAWDVSDQETLEREQRALALAEQELGCQGMLITPKNYVAFLEDIAS